MCQIVDQAVEEISTERQRKTHFLIQYQRRRGNIGKIEMIHAYLVILRRIMTTVYRFVKQTVNKDVVRGKELEYWIKRLTVCGE